MQICNCTNRSEALSPDNKIPITDSLVEEQLLSQWWYFCHDYSVNSKATNKSDTLNVQPILFNHPKCASNGKTEQKTLKGRVKACEKTRKAAFIFTAHPDVYECPRHGLSVSISLSQSLAPCWDSKHRCFRVPAQAKAELCLHTHTKQRERELKTDNANPRSPEKSDNKSDISVQCCACWRFFGFGWCVHRLCKLVIKCKAVTKEWIQLKPLGLECKDKTFQRKNISRQKDRLKCHVNTWRRAYFRK